MQNCKFLSVKIYLKVASWKLSAIRCCLSILSSGTFKQKPKCWSKTEAYRLTWYDLFILLCAAQGLIFLKIMNLDFLDLSTYFLDLWEKGEAARAFVHSCLKFCYKDVVLRNSISNLFIFRLRLRNGFFEVVETVFYPMIMQRYYNTNCVQLMCQL